MGLPAISVFSAPVYKTEEVIPISKSITLTKVKEFYSGHNISYSYIKADLNDKNTDLKLLKSQNGVDKLETVDTLAKTQTNTVAAMNADFFSVYSGTKGFSLGLEIDNGKILESPIYPETMATVSYSDNAIAMGYLEFYLMVVAPNWNYEPVRHLNKHTDYYGDILMYTSEFNGGYSPAPGGNVVEVVVEDGVVKEFRRNMPSVKIPEDGCVLVVSEGSTMFFANNFNVGDKIKFDYYYTPDIRNADMAVGGGAMLVSEGKVITNFSHVVSGYNPRSAIGMSRDGKTLYLVAVDGRQTSSRGMTMSELASLMKDLGCYNAVNFDGGGSTKMVASTVWNGQLTAANSPSENRRVINAVGVTYDAGSNTPTGIILKPDKETVFIGDTVQVSYTVHNENMRPLAETATLTSPYGIINGNSFTPTSSGNAQINANCKNAYGSANVYVIDKVTGINVTDYISLNPGETKTIDIAVFDSLGHYADVTNTSPFFISSSDSSVVSVAGSQITALKNGTAIIAVAKDNAVSYTNVCVGGGESYVYTETFEQQEGSFSSYPATVPGSFALSGTKAFAGKKSGYLTYDFTEESDTTKAVYYNLNTKKTLDVASDRVSVYCYTDKEFNHSLRAQFTDSAGTVHRVVFGKNLKAGNWHNLVANIPKDAVKPVTLDKVYAVYVAGEERDKGGIYIDNLTYNLTGTASGNTKYQASPSNVYSDESAITFAYDNFRIGAVVKSPTTLLSGLVNTHMSSAVGKTKSNAVLGNLKAFRVTEDANAVYITLNTSKGGIRATDSSQWDSMVKAINGSSKKNVFIVSDNSIFGSDNFENQALKEYLESLNKNVVVITNGDKNTFLKDKGVMYFTLCNTEKDALSIQRMNNYKYLEFSFSNGLKFGWKNLYN